MIPTRRVMLLAFAAALAAIPCASLAQQPLQKRIGHWQVVGISGFCDAYNRPYQELNETPYNALHFQVRAGGEWFLQAYFWPDAIKPGAEIQLVLTLAPTHVLTLSAKSPYGVFARAPLGERLRGDLARSPDKMVRIKIDGQQVGITVDIADIDAVFAALEDCAKQFLR